MADTQPSSSPKATRRQRRHAVVRVALNLNVHLPLGVFQRAAIGLIVAGAGRRAMGDFPRLR